MGCGNIVAVLKEGAGVPVCCGKEMLLLKENTVDASVEKHVPVVNVDQSKVTVTCGEVLHPMEENHYIEFMILETNKEVKIQSLHPGEEPSCVFTLGEEETVVASYAYCNLHGLWKK